VLTCKISECELPVRAREYCSKHYKRAVYHGEIETRKMTVTRDTPLIERIMNTGWDEVTRVPALGSCWEWRGRTDDSGYGVLKFHGSVKRPHRVLYEVESGEPLGNLYACHHCDNPKCINPSHIFAGTQRHNMADMVSKRIPKRGNRRHSERDVRAAVSEYQSGGVSQASLERNYGFSSGTLSRILSGKIWVDLDLTP